MCRAPGNLTEEGKQEDRKAGKQKGIVKMCPESGASVETAADKLRTECGMSAVEAVQYASKYDQTD